MQMRSADKGVNKLVLCSYLKIKLVRVNSHRERHMSKCMYEQLPEWMHCLFNGINQPMLITIFILKMLKALNFLAETQRILIFLSCYVSHEEARPSAPHTSILQVNYAHNYNF